MPVTITSQSFKAAALSANECIIGKFYRRQSQPGKLYLCGRRYFQQEGFGPVSSNLPVLYSLTNGHQVSIGMDERDFIEVTLRVHTQDA